MTEKTKVDWLGLIRDLPTRQQRRYGERIFLKKGLRMFLNVFRNIPEELIKKNTIKELGD